MKIFSSVFKPALGFGKNPQSTSWTEADAVFNTSIYMHDFTIAVQLRAWETQGTFPSEAFDPEAMCIQVSNFLGEYGFHYQISPLLPPGYWNKL